MNGVIIPREMREEIFQPFVRFNEREDGKVTTRNGYLDWLFHAHWPNCIKERWLWGKKKIVIPSAWTLPIVQDMTITLTPETKAEPEPVSEVPVEVEQGEKKRQFALQYW